MTDVCIAPSTQPIQQPRIAIPIPTSPQSWERLQGPIPLSQLVTKATHWRTALASQPWAP